MISAGEITINIRARTGACLATVSSSRPVNLHQFFVGKTVDQVLHAIPLVFNICRGAQTVAAVRAAEQALEIPFRANIEKQRDLLVSLEMLHEHLWKLLVDLPPLLGLPPWQKAMARVNQTLQPPMKEIRTATCALATDTGRFTLDPAGPVANTSLHIRQLLFGSEAKQDWTREQLLNCQGVAGALLRASDEVDFQITDTQNCTPLLPMDVHKLYASMKGQNAEIDFISLQQSLTPESSPWESGSLARMRDHPWVKAFNSATLSSRLAALLAETCQLLQGTMVVSIPTEYMETGFGCAEVETARGRLSCALALTVGGNAGGQQPVLTNMQVIAPTDWHFHAQGIAADLLNKIPSDRTLLQKRAELLVKLINPCVGYCLKMDLNTKEDANGHACAIAAASGSPKEVSRETSAIQVGSSHYA